MKMEKEINVYADGGCRGNQDSKNIGGYGVVLEYNGKIKELRHYEANTTNNRMELAAVISGLSIIKKTNKSPINLSSDSVYVVDCIKKKWYVKWQANGWRTADKTEVKNIDLWKKLLPIVAEKDIRYFNVRGHVSTTNALSLTTHHKRFNMKNGTSISQQEFKHIAELNIRADELANISLDEAKAKGV
jgi:ribonuclease HI